MGRTFTPAKGFVVLSQVVLLLCHSAFSQEVGGKPPSNLRVIRMLAAAVGERAVTGIAGRDTGSVRVEIQPDDYGWFMEPDIGNSMRDAGWRPTLSATATYLAQFGVDQILVEYYNIRKDGFFGTKLMDRQISMLVNARVVETGSGDILWGDDLLEKYADTVEYATLSGIESPGVPLTRGELPSEGFFSSVFEPLLVLGTIAVAVILLFSVRS
ncbi:MAG: hypothetical protein WBG01_07890 [Bacteroidota bacterium]